MEKPNYNVDDLVRSNVSVSLPACPAVLVQLCNILENPDSARVELCEVVSADQALCSQVLRLANSAAFGMAHQVDSIDQAVLRIGYQQIWAITMALKAKEMLGAGSEKWSPVNDLWWLHGLKVAVFARFLGRQIDPSRASAFFTAGLMHDLGKWVLLSVAPNYLNICAQGRVFGPVLAALERARLNTDHARLSGELIRFWNLPEFIARLVESHHDVEPGTFGVMGGQYVVPMSDEMAHLTDHRNEDFDMDLELVFPQPVLKRAAMSTKAAVLMVTQYQQLRNVLKEAGI